MLLNAYGTLVARDYMTNALMTLSTVKLVVGKFDLMKTLP